MKYQIIALLAFAIATPIAAHADVDLDTQLHAMVTQKVIQDHQSDIKAGKIMRRAQVKKASATSTTVASNSSTLPTTFGASITRPVQIQELTVAKKVAAVTPVKTTTTSKK